MWLDDYKTYLRIYVKIIWIISNLSDVPDSCCIKKSPKCGKSINDKTENFYEDGCLKKLEKILDDYGVWGVAVAFIILMAVMTTCGLAREMMEENLQKDPQNFKMKVRYVDATGVWRLRYEN